jgi:hypothetical protein
LLALASCASESPEDRLRAALQYGEAAVETKDWSALDDLVSKRYADAAGRDQAQLVDLVRAYLFRLGPVHVLSQTKSLELVAPDRAEVTMLVAVASVPFETLADLERVSADVGLVEMIFVDEDGDWKLLRAEWSPATLDNVL